jgi:hypothetical protein
MKLRYAALAVPVVALGGFLLPGCGNSNEEKLGGQTSQVTAPKEGTPQINSYSEAVKYTQEQAAKERQAGKGKAASKK